jgi:integral membrane protein
MIKLFKYIAIIEGLSFIVILAITMPLKYMMDMPMPNKVAGMLHGVLFIAYVYGVFIVKDKLKWDRRSVIIALVASVIPFGTFYVDRKMLP